jgi:LCP family protein required for cell wall assembly
LPQSHDDDQPDRVRRDSYSGLRDLQAGREPADRSRRAGGGAGRGLRRRWPRRTLIAVNLFVALCLIGGASAYGYVHHELGNVHKVNLSTLTMAHSGPFTVLIVGSDTRDLTGKGNAQFGSDTTTPGQRSDTVMLARVVPATRSMTLLSIPRDLYVHIDGIGESRINAAFNTGPDLLISTIQKDLGIPINHFVEINFDTFQAITDAVGGVKVWFPAPARDAFSLLSVPKAGCVNLTGAQALGFARSRHYQYKVNGKWVTQGLSDLARIQRQQFYVKKMISKAESKLTNPLALNDVLTSVTKNLTVDSAFSTHLMLSLAEDFHSADVAGIPTLTVPTYNEVVGGADVLGLQQPQAREMISSFNTLGNPKPAKVAPKKVTPTTAAPTTATTAPGSHVAVEVANGSGVTGQAGAAAAAIGGLGYKTTVTGETPGYGFTRSEIAYAPGQLAAAQQLAAQLTGGATLTELATLTPTPYSLELVTGASYAGVVGRSSTTPKTTPTAKGTPTAEATPTTKATTKATTPPTTAPAGSSRVDNYLLPGPAPTVAELASC